MLLNLYNALENTLNGMLLDFDWLFVNVFNNKLLNFRLENVLFNTNKNETIPFSMAVNS